MKPADATHYDEFGNFYKACVLSEFCVMYWNHPNSRWAQDLGKDYSHLIKI